MPTRRLGVFAHYDAAGEVKPYILHHLRALRPHCERLVLVSTGALTDEAIGAAREIADDVSLRPNIGFDFGMWKHVLETERATSDGGWDEVLLTNSSVFGPLWPLDEAFSRMRDVGDFWGMTDNHEIKWHLQSYFLVFRRRVLESDAFRRFWAGVYPYKTKWQVILSYEIGMTSCLAEAGFDARAFASAESLFPAGPLAHLYMYKWRNTTAYHPLRLLEHGMPYVKAEVLRDHILTPRKLARLRGAMEARGYDMTMVEFDRPPQRGAAAAPDRLRALQNWVRSVVDPWHKSRDRGAPRR